jgi:hypothetical protein
VLGVGRPRLGTARALLGVKQQGRGSSRREQEGRGCQWGRWCLSWLELEGKGRRPAGEELAAAGARPAGGDSA